MIQLIVGEKGKGKTKIILDKANETAASTEGNVVFVDKDNSHMYELKNNIRLIESMEYSISNADEFAGFVAGIISADHDLQQLFIDRLLKVANIEEAQAEALIRKIDALATKYDVNCVVSVSVTKDQLPQDLQAKVISAL